MASNEESLPLLKQPEVSVPTSHNVEPTNLDYVDTENLNLCMSSVSIPNNLKVASPSLVNHHSYEVLIGGRRPQLKTMSYRRQLFAHILELNMASFLPSLMKEDPVTLGMGLHYYGKCRM